MTNMALIKALLEVGVISRPEDAGDYLQDAWCMEIESAERFVAYWLNKLVDQGHLSRSLRKHFEEARIAYSLRCEGSLREVKCEGKCRWVLYWEK
jgi:hypothetical protein